MSLRNYHRSAVFNNLLCDCFIQRGDVKYLICTDVAARGLDESGLPYGKNFSSHRIRQHEFDSLWLQLYFIGLRKLTIN